MKFIQTTPDISGFSTKLFYEEYGTGKPVIFIHGWPTSHEMWEYQLTELPKHDMRCIAYDRRGFGKSERPWSGYDYDTLADDLKSVIDHLSLTDVTLVGFSMGGGEIARYIGKYGTKNVAKVVLIGAVTPFMLKTDDNPSGVDKSVFDDMIQKLSEDRPAFLTNFAKQFYGVNMLNHPVSQGILDWNQMLCLASSPKATLDCVRSFSETDFRADLSKIDVPTLIIHGDADKIVPISVGGDRTSAMLPNAKYIVYQEAPHGLFITEKNRLNKDLIDFISPMTSNAKMQDPAQYYSNVL